ncbi:MAG: hypothetical protein F6J93_21395 [Oscillatoria sp. SIO1A7]|nr:hypothetical protein [Oscillatoria sp. SIO1A7]
MIRTILGAVGAFRAMRSTARRRSSPRHERRSLPKARADGIRPHEPASPFAVFVVQYNGTLGNSKIAILNISIVAYRQFGVCRDMN